MRARGAVLGGWVRGMSTRGNDAKAGAVVFAKTIKQLLLCDIRKRPDVHSNSSAAPLEPVPLGTEGPRWCLRAFGAEQGVRDVPSWQ